MQVNSASPSTFPDTTPVSDPSVGLTDDDMFSYCEAQMNSIDSTVTGYVSDQNTNVHVKQAIGQAMDELRAWQAKMGASGVQTDHDEVEKIKAELEQIQAQYPAGASSIQGAIDTLTTNGMGGTDDTVSSGDIDKMLSTLSDVNNGIDSNNQMAMIHLQSAMSQRQQVIQLTTNILQALNDSDAKVIANIHS